MPSRPPLDAAQPSNDAEVKSADPADCCAESGNAPPVSVPEYPPSTNTLKQTVSSLRESFELLYRRSAIPEAEAGQIKDLLDELDRIATIDTPDSRAWEDLAANSR